MLANSFYIWTLLLFTSGLSETVLTWRVSWKSKWIHKSVNCKGAGWWRHSSNPISRNRMKIPAKKFIAETSTSKITESCQLWMVAFVKTLFLRCQRLVPQGFAAGMQGAMGACQNCRRQIHSALQISFPGTNDASSDSACDSVIPSCVGAEHITPKVRHGPQGIEYWSWTAQKLGRGQRTPERRSWLCLFGI